MLDQNSDPLPFIDISKEFDLEEVLKIKGKEYVVASMVPSGCYIKIVPRARFDAQKQLAGGFRRPGQRQGKR